MSLIPEIDAFLGCPTPDAWIEAALADQETLLIDRFSINGPGGVGAGGGAPTGVGLGLRGGGHRRVGRL